MPHHRPHEARPPLDAETRRRLSLVVARLASSHDGERLAALAAAERILGPRGLDLRRLIAAALEPPPASGPPPLPDDAAARELLARIKASGATLDPWSERFLASIAFWRGRLTDRQRAKLAEIAARAGLAS